jgi:hypothetical protein
VWAGVSRQGLGAKDNIPQPSNYAEVKKRMELPALLIFMLVNIQPFSTQSNVHLEIAGAVHYISQNKSHEL